MSDHKPSILLVDDDETYRTRVRDGSLEVRAPHYATLQNTLRG